MAGAEFTAYLKSSLPVKADGSYDFDKATPVVIGENGATTITSDDKGHAVSIAIPYGTYVVVESKTPHNMKTIKPWISIQWQLLRLMVQVAWMLILFLRIR